MPLLLRRMSEEEQIKMKAQVVSCAVSFVTNLTGSSQNEDEVSPEAKEEGKKIITMYSEQLVQAISTLLQLSITSSYQPL